MMFEHAMLQDYAHLFPVAGTESLEYRTFECILVEGDRSRSSLMVVFRHFFHFGAIGMKMAGAKFPAKSF